METLVPVLAGEVQGLPIDRSQGMVWGEREPSSHSRDAPNGCMVIAVMKNHSS